MQPPAPLVLHNTTLIDATGAGPRHNISLELREGRIARIFPASQLPASPDATVIDLAGHFLLPGLTVEEGKLADLTVFDRDPLTDPEVLADAERVRLVLKAGAVVKDADGRTCA